MTPHERPTTRLLLRFSEGDEPELEASEFSHPSLPGPRHACRGKDEGANEGFATFQWTAVVKVLTVWLLRCAAWARAVPEGRGPCPVLEGVKRTPAASLNWALSKGQ